MKRGPNFETDPSENQNSGGDFMSADKVILDACCGSRMFWFDKEHPRAVYIDEREVDTVLCGTHPMKIDPDMLADFRAMPFEDESFYLVVFDRYSNGLLFPGEPGGQADEVINCRCTEIYEVRG